MDGKKVSVKEHAEAKKHSIINFLELGKRTYCALSCFLRYFFVLSSLLAASGSGFGNPLRGVFDDVYDPRRFPVVGLCAIEGGMYVAYRPPCVVSGDVCGMVVLLAHTSPPRNGLLPPQRNIALPIDDL